MQESIKIPEFMLKKLHLSGNELLIYALIFNFQLEHLSYFNKSYTYIAKRLNINVCTAIRIINKLVENGLIEKRQKIENGEITNFFKALK